MTRRVRFSPRDRVRSGVFSLSLLLASAGSAPAAEVPFGPAAVVGTPSLPMRTAPGDLDRDGDLDFASAGRFGVVWHENVGGAGSSWTSHTVATTTGIFASVAQGDVDRDGDVDLVATIVDFDRTLWYENTAGNGSAWTQHTIATGIDGPRDAVLADVDGDGDPDVVSTAVLTANVLHWHENVAGNGTTWIRRTIATAVYSASSVSAADVDRDGDVDVMASSTNDDTVAWYENVDGAGGAWATRTIANPSYAGGHLTAADIDGDGDLDAVTSVQGAGPIELFENLDGHGGAWSARPIATPPLPVRSTTAADLDGDGDLDVMAPVGNTAQPGTAVWYENADGDGTTWTERMIGTMGPGAYQVIAADVDGDGDQDAASVSFYGEILWYRNQSIHRTAHFVPQPDIAVGPGTSSVPIHLTASDVDGDGDRDVVSGALGEAELSWQENVGGAGSAWARHVIATASGRIYGAPAADLDGDADVDVATTPQHALTAFRNGGSGSSWTPSPIAPFPTFQVRTSVRVADVDGDGETDVVAADDVGNRLLWFESAGDGVGWTPRTVAAGVLAYAAHPLDVDRDGDADIVASLVSGTVWYENLGGAASWAVHTMAPGTYVLVPADPDGDGDADVFASNATGLYWIENTSGGASWAVHTVVTDAAPVYWTHAADLDGDGDQDAVAGRLSLEGPFWVENAAGDGSVWTRRTLLPTVPSPMQAIAADVDDDGDLDLLSSHGSPSTVGWLRNEPGQVRFELADQVPPSVENDDVFSMLRITVTHGGRAGDSDLELARLGLRFQEDAAADPLTSAEANALIEELRVYRDADGNGTFDLALDTLVATVPTLALTAGVLTVGFADGDANVRVAFGTPAAFFVVAQLTANASEQAPNQFRVVHLATGPSATRAEDAAADIVLSAVGPADFQSGLVGRITPVELSGFTVE